MRELTMSKDTMGAVRRIQAQKVPVAFQASEFSNILTRVAEERCGGSRRAAFAFAASLAGGAFEKDQCAKGTSLFFEDVYEDLCEEDPRLNMVLKSELVPTLQAAFSVEKLNKLLPAGLH